MADRDPIDEIVRSLTAQGLVRVVAVTTTGVAREAARRHDAGPAASVALARGLTAGLLLATLTKDEERVTLQVLGDGELGGLTVDADAAGTARAYVKNPESLRPLPVAGGRPSLALAMGGEGVVSVIRDVGLRENFSGQTPMRSGEVDEDVAYYLNASEQIPSALACDALLDAEGRIQLSAGILVQALPGSEGAEEIQFANELLRDGGFLRALASDPADGAAVIAASLGGRLGEVRILDRRPVVFHCPCSRHRAAASLAVLGETELASMIVEDGKAEVICNFCRARYHFDDVELEEIRRETAKPHGPPS
jgi:molecular chaperone Hsp33